MADIHHTPPRPHLRVRVPSRVTLSIPLDQHGETTLDELRCMLQMAEHMPDSTPARAWVPMDPAESGRLTIGNQEV